MIILKSVDEAALLEANHGTCVEGNQCRVIQDLKKQTPGTSITHPMPNKCVLCCRWYVQMCYLNNSPLDPKVNLYRNFHDEYDMDVFTPFTPNLGITFPIVRYDAPMPIETKKSQLMQVSSVVNEREPKPFDWFLLECPECKTFKNTMDKYFACGFDETVYDMSKNQILCMRCKTPTMKNFCDVYGNVLYESQYYSKCYFCTTVTTTKLATVQTCLDCTKQFENLLQKSNRKCFYCEVILNDKKKFTSYLVKDKGEVRLVYLCKLHSISRRTITKFKCLSNSNLFELETFISILNNKRQPKRNAAQPKRSNKRTKT